MEPMGSHVLFVRNDGLFAIDHINEANGQRVETQSGSGFSPNWTHVVAVGPHILFVRNDPAGTYAVGHINETNGHFVETQQDKGMAPDWTHVVAVGPHILFVRKKDGRFAVGHIDLSKGHFVETQDGTLMDPESSTVFTGAAHVVAVRSHVLLGRDDAFEVGHIDEANSQWVPTQGPGPGVGGFPDPMHVVAVGPHVLGVSPTRTAGFVLHINQSGQFVETETGPDFASDWTHVVAVA